MQRGFQGIEGSDGKKQVSDPEHCCSWSPFNVRCSECLEGINLRRH